MSIFASATTKIVSLPFDAPHTVTIQKLTGADIERAQADHLDALTNGRRPRGWAALFQKALTDGTATALDADKAVHDPLAGYDRLTVVKRGVKAWSYTETDEKGAERPKPVTAAAIADIADEPLEFLAVEIMRLTKPALFQTPEEAEAARKNA